MLCTSGAKFSKKREITQSPFPAKDARNGLCLLQQTHFKFPIFKRNPFWVVEQIASLPKKIHLKTAFDHLPNRIISVYPDIALAVSI